MALPCMSSLISQCIPALYHLALPMTLQVPKCTTPPCLGGVASQTYISFPISLDNYILPNSAPLESFR